MVKVKVFGNTALQLFQSPLNAFLTPSQISSNALFGCLETLPAPKPSTVGTAVIFGINFFAISHTALSPLTKGTGKFKLDAE